MIALVKIMLEKQNFPEFSQKETCQKGNNLPLPGFFWSILWWSDIDHHPQEPTLARERKVEKFKNPAIFWWPAGTYCLNMAISDKNSQNLATLMHFPHNKNPLYESHLIIMVVKWWKFHPKLMHAWYRRKAIAKRMNIPLLVWKGLEYSNTGLVLNLNILAASSYWVCSKFSY